MPYKMGYKNKGNARKAATGQRKPVKAGGKS